MRKKPIRRERIKGILACISLILIGFPAPVFAQQEPQKEYVHVVNMELILRVCKDGSPVGSLKKDDFSLYEDGEKIEINGFFEVHRRMAPADPSQKQPQAPRLYLLFFWIDNPDADVEGVLDRFFSGMYREGDRVLLITPLKTFELPSPQDKAGITAAFLEQWRQEARDRSLKKAQIHNELQRIFEDFREFGNMQDFIFRYSQEIKEYQNRELLSDTSAFEAMARSLLPITNDKFALVFFQHDSLPLLDVSTVRDSMAVAEDKIREIERQAKAFANPDGFSQKLKSLFIQANTQFHLLFLSPDTNTGPMDAGAGNSFTKNEEVLSNWEQAMREISKNTGGLMLDGDRMVAALDQVAAFEDIYYHVTYVPREQGSAERKIEVRVNQPGLTVIHGRMLEMKEPPALKIAEISASGQSLRLVLADFYPISKEGVPTGSVNVVVTGKHAPNESPRLLVSQASETSGVIDLPLALPQPGTWDLEVRVVDQITGQQGMKRARMEAAAAVHAIAPAASYDTALAALLAKAAANAEKLKIAAFHFFCQEKVTEENFGPNARFDRTASRSYWIHDYQIIGQDEKITENRVLIEKDREKLHRENARLETVFRSFYSFYMPVRILAGEKQPLYRYQLLDKKKKTWHIKAVRNDPALPIPSGEIWVNEGNGAVLKIQLEQNSIVGFEKIAEEAKKMGLRPEIVTIHEFAVVENGIRFPSRTVFIERYHSDVVPTRELSGAAPTRKSGEYVRLERGHRFFERSRTYFEYKKYRFFSVAMHVSEKTE